MTKQQIIDALALKYSKVAPETEWKIIKTIIGVELILIPVWKIDGNAMWENGIIVCKDGTDYYWKNSEPETVNFNQRVLAFVDAKIQDGTVKFAVIDDINTTNKKATITAIMPDKSEKRAILTESTLNNFAIEVL